MTDTAEGPAVRKQGNALIIKLPHRGKRRQVIPEALVENLLAALRDLSLEVGEGVAVPKEDDPDEPRMFDKQHQATNYGRKLKDELAEKDPKLGELTLSTPSMGHDASGKATGPFALALTKKAEKKGKS